MSVTLFEPALRALLDTEQGPVGLFVRREAEKVVEAMKDDVRGYFDPADTGAQDDVALGMTGSTATVVLQDDPQGRSTRAESKSARYTRLGRFEKTRRAARL